MKKSGSKTTRLCSTVYCRDCLHLCFSVAKMGQSGIISCLALNPQINTMYAAGSFNRTGFSADNFFYNFLCYHACHL